MTILREVGITSSFERAGSTAIRRLELSRPVRIGLETGIIRDRDDVFDYGCGHGHDVELLADLGLEANGWDPCHRSDAELRTAQVVNLGYVLNVIEDPMERSEALRRAWELADRALLVAVRTADEERFVSNGRAHADGVLTGADTFQKFFTQAEARGYIDETLDATSIPLAPGVFVAFKDEAVEQDWLENRAMLRRRVRRLRRISAPCKTLRDEAYETHRELLRPLEEFLAERGRLPRTAEHEWTAPIEQALGSIRRAFQVIRHVADEPWWETATDDRRDELLVRFALDRLRKRPKYSSLPTAVQGDVRALFGSYKEACQRADDLLFSIADAKVMRSAVQEASLGKATPDAFYVHKDGVDLLPPALRVFIGAADALIGDVVEATIIKCHLNKPHVSYLVYPEFDGDPHPALAESWVVDFRELDVRPHDYRERANPPVLHRKELFVPLDHPRRETFARLSTQEERHGLLEDPMRIGYRDAWEERLASAGWQLRGHRLVRA